MAATKHWTVDVYLDEDIDHTHAEARLRVPAAGELHGKGAARRNPQDRSVPEIGDELAAARALFDLARRLLRTAEDEVERMTGHPAHLHT
ncbi:MULTISPECIES: DUF1876 domain-containing protein [Saccharopolyspora]|nr:DUF1876 domain-containing protein [Saccharopolyspora elongata]